MAECPEASTKNYPNNSDLGARRYRGARRQLRTHSDFDRPSGETRHATFCCRLPALRRELSHQY